VTFARTEKCGSYADCDGDDLCVDNVCQPQFYTTTTEGPIPGCCAASTNSSDYQQSNERCQTKEGIEQCERADGCFWVHGEYADCGVPGCCAMNPSASLSLECCAGMESERDCMALTRGDSERLCAWVESDDPERDCYGATTTEGPGCCRMRADASIALGCCAEMDSRTECEGITGAYDRLCEWVGADEYGQCDDDDGGDWRTTTKEPSDGAYDVRGCCVADASTDCEDTAWYYVCGSQKGEAECVATVDGEGTPCEWAAVEIEAESVAFDYALPKYDADNCRLKNMLFFSSFFCL